MKKNKKLVFILFIFLFFVSYSFAQEREVPPVKFMKISDRLYEITGGAGANSGVYIGDLYS